jgi:hypothetical protein
MKLLSYKSQRKISTRITKKQEFQLKWWHKLLFLSPIIIIALILKGNEWYESYMLNQNKDSTWAVLTKVTLSGVRDAFDTDNVAFEYIVGGNYYTGTVSVPVNHKYVLGNLDLPLFEGQRYRLYFASNKPNISKIDFTKPDTTTILGYIKKASYIVQKLLNIDIEKAKCIANKIFITFGYNGLAYIFFHNEFVVENFKHNSKTFSSFWGREEIKTIINNCAVKQ